MDNTTPKMPEVICLISSSPTLAQRSATPPPAKKPRNGAAKLTAVAAPFDLTGDTPAPKTKTKKTYIDSTFSVFNNGPSTINSRKSSFEPKNAAPTADANAKMNDKDFVFVNDDGYSSEIDLGKEYSLHLSQLKERAKASVAAAQAERNGPASSPIGLTKSTNSAAPAKSTVSSRAPTTFNLSTDKPIAQRNYRSPVAALKKTAIDKPSGIGNKEYVFLDDDFSSSIGLDKEYDGGLPAQKRRKVTPEPEAHNMSEREKERHGLLGLFSSPEVRRAEISARGEEGEKRGMPDLFSSPEKRRAAVPEKQEGVGKHGLPDPFSPSPNRAKAKPAPAVAEKHGLPDLFNSPGSIRSAVLGKRIIDAEKYTLPDPFSPSPKRAKSKQAQVDAATTKATANEASLPKSLKRTQDRVLDSDPIAFTSSPDFAQMEKDRRKRHEQALSKAKQLSDVDEPAGPSKVSTALKALDSDSDELPELPSLGGASRALSRTTSDISHLNTSRSAAAPRFKPLARSKSMADHSVKPKKRVPKTDDEKAAEAAEKAAAKEAEAERKRLLREEKAREKVIAQDLAKVNMLKTDKKKSTPEMIVLFPQEMDKKLKETAEGFLAKLSVEYRNWAGAGATPGEIAGSGMVKNVVRWKRKVDAVHNEREDIWEPVPRRIENEKHVLVHLLAKEFVELATTDGHEDLNQHAVKLKSRFCDHKVIYLIEGLTSWQKKNANLRNRQFAAAVRAQSDSAEAPTSSQTTTSSRGRKKKPPPEYIPDDLIEDALLSLQIRHKVLIHHTASLVESAEWISIFTQHISTIPYRLQKMNLDTSFCMESGQVRAGEDARDTFVKLLCEMRGVTASVGWGVEAEIGGGLKQLVERFRKEGKEALAQAKKGANRDGAFTDRNVGKAISKRIHNVFMGRDPGSTDV